MKPVIFIVLDGWGINLRRDGNAQLKAKMPALDRLFKEYPVTRLNASGLSVGLPDGQMGNSEVGPLTMGQAGVLCSEPARLDRVFIHACLDGRQTPPTRSRGYREKLHAYLYKTGAGKRATISGPYYAM